MKNAPRAATEFRALARKAAVGTRNCPMLEDLGSIEARDGNLSTATDYFKRARTCYRNNDDILRAALEEADAWFKQKKLNRAVDLIRAALRTAPDVPAASLLKKIEQNLSATPAASPNKP